MEEDYQLLEYHHQIVMRCDATVQALDFYYYHLNCEKAGKEAREAIT